MIGLNRLLALILLLLLLAAAVLTLSLVTGALTADQVYQIWPYAPGRAIARDVALLNADTYQGAPIGPFGVGTPVAPVIGVVVALLALLALLGIVRELSPPPRRARLLVLRGDAPGYTEIAYDTLDELAAYSARGVTGVERARARVEPKNGALDVRCRALVTPFADLATMGPEVERTIAAGLTRATGLPVRTVRMRAVVQGERARRQVR